MKTAWDGTNLSLHFENRTITLTTAETKEFEEWFMKRFFQCKED